MEGHWRVPEGTLNVGEPGSGRSPGEVAKLSGRSEVEEVVVHGPEVPLVEHPLSQPQIDLSAAAHHLGRHRQEGSRSPRLLAIASTRWIRSR